MSNTLFKGSVGEPLTALSLEKELFRLCSADSLKKKSVASNILFPTVEKHFESCIDRDVRIPFVPHSYIYMSDEGFLTVFAVVYTLSRTACKELFAKAEANGEYIFLTIFGETDKGAKGAADAFALSERAISALSVIAESSGFSLSLSVAQGKLAVSIRFLRLRAVPVSGYSCSRDFVEGSVERALSLFEYFKNIK